VTPDPAALDELRALLAELRRRLKGPQVYYTTPGRPPAGVPPYPAAEVHGMASAVADTLDRVLAWFGLHPQERAFLHYLAEDRLSYTSEIFADWLADHGRDAEGRRVRLLRPRPGDVVVLQASEEGMGGMTRDVWQDLSARLRDAFTKNVTVVLPPGWDFGALDPDQMRAAGWVRADEAVPPSPRPSGCARCGHPDLTYGDFGGGSPTWACRNCRTVMPPPLPADAPPR
jgi:hypothetical protein